MEARKLVREERWLPKVRTSALDADLGAPVALR